MNQLLKLLFQAGLSLNAALTRTPGARIIEGRILTPFFVSLTRVVRGRPRQPVAPEPAALGREWERLLGDRPFARVTHVDAESQTVYGEIGTHCPLRGTGDVAACHRLMAYDRGLMAPFGARFVVLESQAELGKTRCKVAMRPALLDASDLVPAHRRVASAAR